MVIAFRAFNKLLRVIVFNYLGIVLNFKKTSSTLVVNRLLRINIFITYNEY